MAQQQIAKEDRSIGELFSELAADTGTLIRQEVALAQTEISQKASRIGKNIGFLVVGGAIGYAALLTILAAVIVGLANFMPLWVSAMIIGAVLAIAAGVMISSALKKLKETNLVPQQTVETFKEDAKWLKKQV